MDNAREIGARLKKWRSNQGLTQAGLAAAIGRSQSAIGDVESGRQLPSRALLELFRSKLGVSTDWLLGGNGNNLAILEPEQHAKTFKPDPLNKPLAGEAILHGQEISLIRRYEINISAGPGIVVSDDLDDEAVAFSNNWLNRERITPQLSGMVRVEGDSMEPTIPNGALVLVHAPEMEVDREAIYAFTRSGEAFIKRLVPSGKDEHGRPSSLTIISDNRRYATEVVSNEALSEIRIVGRVRCAMVKF